MAIPDQGNESFGATLKKVAIRGGMLLTASSLAAAGIINAINNSPVHTEPYHPPAPSLHEGDAQGSMDFVSPDQILGTGYRAIDVLADPFAPQSDTKPIYSVTSNGRFPQIVDAETQGARYNPTGANAESPLHTAGFVGIEAKLSMSRDGKLYLIVRLNNQLSDADTTKKLELYTVKYKVVIPGEDTTVHESNSPQFADDKTVAWETAGDSSFIFPVAGGGAVKADNIIDGQGTLPDSIKITVGDKGGNSVTFDLEKLDLAAAQPAQ